MCIGPFAPKVPAMPAPPPPPPPLPPPPDTSDAGVSATLADERKKRRLQASLAQGRSSDIRTTALGLPGQAEGLKTALGA